MPHISRTLLIYTVATAASGLAAAAPPATSPYFTDPQNPSVQDVTACCIGSLNMVLCVIERRILATWSTPGRTSRWSTWCQANNGGSSSASAGATNFANAVVEVTRASNSALMIGKVWLSLTEEGSTTNVYVYLSANTVAGERPPYGAFRMDYIGEKDGSAGFNGYIDSTTPGEIKFLESGQQSSNTALAMSTSSSTAGSGTMFVGGNGGGSSPVTFNFSYNPGYFRRSDGTNDQCFDRSSANATTAVWQYGTLQCQ